MKRKIDICCAGHRRSFRLDIGICCMLDKMGVSMVDTETVCRSEEDYYFFKSSCTALKSAGICARIDVDDPDSPQKNYDAVKESVHPRLQVALPVSTVQMEYLAHRKPAAMLETISKTVSDCAQLCGDVEFVAEDFTRSDEDFLVEAIKTACSSGATTICLHDTAGNILPGEFASKVKNAAEAIPAGIKLSVACSNEYYLAEAYALEAVRNGADEIRTSLDGKSLPSLLKISRILEDKSDALDIECGINHTLASDSCNKIAQMVKDWKAKSAASVIGGNEMTGNQAETVEDNSPIPEKYKLESFLINSGNFINPSCHVKLSHNGESLETVCIGDGPIDAAFLAIEKLIGKNYELDDYQIKSVTEGREAMGEAMVTLRHKGKLYFGKEVSTDIMRSSIMAYLKAANRISYEEEA